MTRVNPLPPDNTTPFVYDLKYGKVQKSIRVLPHNPIQIIIEHINTTTLLRDNEWEGIQVDGFFAHSIDDVLKTSTKSMTSLKDYEEALIK